MLKVGRYQPPKIQSSHLKGPIMAHTQILYTGGGPEQEFRCFKTEELNQTSPDFYAHSRHNIKTAKWNVQHLIYRQCNIDFICFSRSRSRTPKVGVNSSQFCSTVTEFQSDDIIKIKFAKLWDLSRYSERRTSKMPTYQKLAFWGKLSLKY